MEKYYSKQLYAQDGPTDGTLCVENGAICAIEPGMSPGAADFGEYRIIPGIIDTHVHGNQGYSMSPEGFGSFEEQLNGFLKSLAGDGVTSVFPTLFGMSPANEQTLDVISLIAGRVGQPADGAEIAGIHYEGPYLNRVGEHGTWTQPPEIDLGFVREVIKAADGKLKLMGLAPELPGTYGLIDLLLANNVAAAFTHTDCMSAEAFAAFDRGISVATHLCNVMTGIHHRDVGGLGAAILDGRVSCELICDGLHVTNNMIEIILRATPHERIMMISDCTGLSGAPPGTYESFLGLEGFTIVDESGFVKEPGGRLRGSTKSVLYGVGNLVGNLGYSLEEVLRLSSANAACKYGLSSKAALAPGKDADFVVIDSDYNALKTYVRGRKVFDRKTDEVFNKEIFVSAFLKTSC